MISRIGARGALAGALALFVAAPAFADVTLTVSVDGEENRMYLTETRMALKSGPDTIVFDSAKGEIRFVSAETRETRVMTREQMEQMGAMMKQFGGGEGGDPMAVLRQQMLATIETLPADQREAALKELNQRMPDPAAAGKMSFDKTGDNPEINGWQTTGYSIRNGNGELGTMWVAELKEVGLSRKDLAVLGTLREFVVSGMGDSPMAMKILDEFQALDPTSPNFVGFPVKKTHDGQTVELVSVDHGAVDADVFKAGADYPVKSMMER
ncbi:MAG: hypothetical protein HKN12_01030 [Gemmatimonadetes bacterium]|nr:hypothetical protein [Gemmatimonadota bacterium]